MRQHVWDPPMLRNPERRKSWSPNIPAAGSLDLFGRRPLAASCLVLLLSNLVTKAPKARAYTSVRESPTHMGALDRRIGVALQLFETGDPTGGEQELKEMVQHHPWYAPGWFYMGLLSHKRNELERAVEFYAAAMHAALSPADRTRVAAAVGLLQGPEEQNKSPARDNATGADPKAVDEVVENLFLKALHLEPTHRWALINLGLHLHTRGRNDEAAAIFARALEVYPADAEVNYNQGVVHKTLGEGQMAAQYFASTLQVDHQHVGAAFNLAALHHRYGDPADAIEQYRNVAEMIDPDDTDMIVMLRNNLGTALFQIGEYTLAMDEFTAVLALLEASDKILYHDRSAEGMHDVYVESLVNLLRVRKASCDWHDWERQIFVLKTQVDNRQLGAGRAPSVFPFDSLLLPFPATPAWRRQIAEAHSLRYADAPTASERRDELLVDGYHHGQELGTRAAEQAGGEVVYGDEGGKRASERGESTAYTTTGSDGARGPLSIAFIGHDFNEQHPTAKMIEGAFVWQRRLTRVHHKGRGVSEAHETGGGRNLGESSFANLSSPMPAADCCRYSVYSYGGEERDGTVAKQGGEGTSSRTRESIRACASSFVELYASGHRESIERIRVDGVDILVDLQGHTLGGRSEIVAARPARVQVNYLVFPGTSGAPYMDFLLADRHVTPPEHAVHYSESLVLLPRTYQVNLYEDLVPPEAYSSTETREKRRSVLRREQGLPADLSRAVFANFNKIDKLDPESFFLWMQILRRVPGSVLWLLKPKAADTEMEAIRKRLRKEAESQGIDGHRIIWASRVSKHEHLERQALADLFLDTCTYGAHSTASDALAGGLPFLTLAGESFASRVGVSLLRNAGPLQSALLVAGQREFEDLAVELVSSVRGWKFLDELRASLKEGCAGLRRSRTDEDINNVADPARERTRAEERGERILPIFDTRAVTKDLNHAFMLMSDVHDLWKDRDRDRDRVAVGRGDTRLPHIVMTGKSTMLDIDG